MKDPKKVKAGRARWLSMSAKKRKQFMSENGKKGALALWSKIRSGSLSTTPKKVLDTASERD